MALWQDTVRLILERPWLGWGHDQFIVVHTASDRPMMQPHNTPLSLAFDFGLLGGGAAALGLLLLWVRALKVTRAVQAGAADDAVLAAFTGLNALIVIAMFDGVLYHPEPLAMVALCFAALLGRQRAPV